ncbi:hypothetical protein ACFFX0_28480 [Citricoccus parietis]|uniref:Uncharacterized protein n=1 Tax=Citricoccus parietis TaxID=592307 RepID=A0ABV5G7H5_9MICC
MPRWRSPATTTRPRRRCSRPCARPPPSTRSWPSWPDSHSPMTVAVRGHTQHQRSRVRPALPPCPGRAGLSRLPGPSTTAESTASRD